MTREAIKAKLIVERIIADLCDRSGIGDAWCDIDLVTTEEIKDTWQTIALNVIEGK